MNKTLLELRFDFSHILDPYSIGVTFYPVVQLKNIRPFFNYSRVQSRLSDRFDLI